jgi:hypothetical protein
MIPPHMMKQLGGMSGLENMMRSMGGTTGSKASTRGGRPLGA